MSMKFEEKEKKKKRIRKKMKKESNFFRGHRCKSVAIFNPWCKFGANEKSLT